MSRSVVRCTLTASYAVSNRLTLLARVPWSARDLTAPEHEELKHGERINEHTVWNAGIAWTFGP